MNKTKSAAKRARTNWWNVYTAIGGGLFTVLGIDGVHNLRRGVSDGGPSEFWSVVSLIFGSLLLGALFSRLLSAAEQNDRKAS